MNSREAQEILETITAQPEDVPQDVPINYDDVPMPSLEKILEMIDGMQGISDEEKNSLLRSVLSQSDGNMNLEQLNSMKSSPSYQFLVLFGLLFIMTLIFVFFGYKLYKSLTEKEKKREEKRKQKQMKKKK